MSHGAAVMSSEGRRRSGPFAFSAAGAIPGPSVLSFEVSAGEPDLPFREGAAAAFGFSFLGFFASRLFVLAFARLKRPPPHGGALARDALKNTSEYTRTQTNIPDYIQSFLQKYINNFAGLCYS